jgi:hypothetical protein
MAYTFSRTRLSKASKDSFWRALQDMEGWSEWGRGRRTRVISQKVLSRDGNTALCEVDEVVSGIRTRHQNRYTFHAEGRVDAEFLSGPAGGGFSIELTPIPEGTRTLWHYTIEPRSLGLKILTAINARALQSIGIQYSDQLAEYVESHP